MVVEADGGSRGNPGPSAYGAVLKDADSGVVIAEKAARIGVTTNNVAEYSGLLAGLELYRELADGAELEVRMDSRLVVEQMAGNWKIKHPGLKPLATRAAALAPVGATYTWVPREQNRHADALANEALDGPEDGGILRAPEDSADVEVAAAVQEAPRSTTARASGGAPGRPPWEQGPPTMLVLVRHGDTDHTRDRRFSGRDGANPPLNEDGRAQVRATARWLAPLAANDPVLLSSPLQRTRDTAAILAEELGGLPITVEAGLAEAAFGTWEGLTYAQVMERDGDAFGRWIQDVTMVAGGHGDSMASMDERMREVGDRLRAAYPGRTVVAASHLTPIKLLAGQVLETPLSALFRTEITPASVTILAWYPDGRGVVRLLNGQPAAHHFATGAGVR